MTDSFDDRLASAGRVLSDDADLSSALLALGEARAAHAPVSRRRRLLLPSIIIGSLLAVSGAGAVVATQWLPWETANPDLVVAREWTDVNGTYLGSCETRVAASTLSADTLARARNYLNAIDVDSVAPHPWVVAMELQEVGRSEDLGRLILGATAEDFEIGGQGGTRQSDWYSDARILQDALTWAVFDELRARFEADGFDGNSPEFLSLIVNEETQCTTDPTRTPSQ